MPSDFVINAIFVSRSTTILVPIQSDQSAPTGELVATLPAIDYKLLSTIDYELSSLALHRPFANLAYVADTTSMTVLHVSGSFPLFAKDLLAAFTLERDEDGDMIFADTTGAMYGIGRNFLQAVHDWHDSAQELESQLQEHTGDLLQQVAEQLQLFERVLSEGPAIGQS
jgi:hypothetical protein